MKSLGLRFRLRVNCLEVHVDDAASAFPELGELNGKDAPFFFTKTAGDEKWTQHVGEMNAEGLSEVLESVALPVPEDDAPESKDPRGDNRNKKNSKESSAAKESEPQSMFPPLLAEDFQKQVLTQNAGQLVIFTKLANPTCLNASIAVGKALVKIAGHVNAFEVNASDVAALEITKRYAPLLVGDSKQCVVVSLFPHGDKEDVEPEYFGVDPEGTSKDVKVDSKAIASWVHEQVPDFVVSLSATSVETFLQTSPEVPKLVLFSKGDRPSRAFTALAANFQDDFLFASVPEQDEHVATQFGVTARPAIRLLYLDSSNLEAGAQYAAAAYPAPNLVYQQMHAWLQMVQVQVLGKDLDEDGSVLKSDVAPVDVPFAETTEQFDAACESAPLCVVAFVNRMESDGVTAASEKDLEAVTTAAGLTRERPAKYVMVDVTSQRSFANAFDVLPSDAPCVVVVSTRKNRFATSIGAFEGRSIAQFLEDVLASKQKTQMIQEIPKLVVGGEVAFVEEVFEEVEEEFDLSDIMNEEVEGEVSKEETQQRIERELEEEARAAEAAKAAEAAEAEAVKKKAVKKKKKKKKKKSEL
jgi:hypothetical protein